MSNISELPSDIWRDEILLRLPAKSLFRFRAVCKRWCKVIDDPNFSRAHNNNQLMSSSSSHSTDLVTTYSSSEITCSSSVGPLSNSYSLYTFNLEASNFDDGAKIISGSSLESSPILWPMPVSTCNGLVLVNTGTTFLEIWNLSTNERLQLPPLLDFSSSRWPACTGLGYDHAAQDFKAVAIQGQLTHVYSLKSDTWRELTEDFPGVGCYIGDGWLAPQYHGVFMCGALHWLSCMSNDSSNEIVALDLGTEKHRIIQLPPSHEKIMYENIDVLGGCLLAQSGISVSDFHFVLWVMKDYGSDDESWTKLLSMEIERGQYSPYYERLRPVDYVKDKNHVFLKDGRHEEFLVLDVESNSIKKRVRIHGLPKEMDAQMIRQSIFRLRDHCGVSGTSRIKPFNNRTRKNMEVSITINTE